MNDIRAYIKLLEGSGEQSRFSYEDAGKNASPFIQQAIAEFHKLPDDVKNDTPLLYYILGSGTPPYKMSREDSEYTDNSNDSSMTCGNCEFSYQKVINKKFICSQIQDHIQLSGHCNQWVKGTK